MNAESRETDDVIDLLIRSIIAEIDRKWKKADEVLRSLLETRQTPNGSLLQFLRIYQEECETGLGELMQAGRLRESSPVRLSKVKAEIKKMREEQTENHSRMREIERLEKHLQEEVEKQKSQAGKLKELVKEWQDWWIRAEKRFSDVCVLAEHEMESQTLCFDLAPLKRSPETGKIEHYGSKSLAFIPFTNKKLHGLSWQCQISYKNGPSSSVARFSSTEGNGSHGRAINIAGKDEDRYQLKLRIAIKDDLIEAVWMPPVMIESTTDTEAKNKLEMEIAESIEEVSERFLRFSCMQFTIEKTGDWAGAPSSRCVIKYEFIHPITPNNGVNMPDYIHSKSQSKDAILRKLRKSVLKRVSLEKRLGLLHDLRDYLLKNSSDGTPDDWKEDISQHEEARLTEISTQLNVSNTQTLENYKTELRRFQDKTPRFIEIDQDIQAKIDDANKQKRESLNQKSGTR